MMASSPIDETLASEHGLKVGSLLDVRGGQLPIVGLSRGTSGFAAPLAFTTRTTANKLNDQPDTATFLLVNPQADVAQRRSSPASMLRFGISALGAMSSPHATALPSLEPSPGP